MSNVFSEMGKPNLEMAKDFSQKMKKMTKRLKAMADDTLRRKMAGLSLDK